MSCISMQRQFDSPLNYFKTNHIYFPPNFFKTFSSAGVSSISLQFILFIKNYKYAKFKNGWRHYLFLSDGCCCLIYISKQMCRFTRNDIWKCSWKGRWLSLCTLIHAHNVWPDDGAMEMFCLTNQGVDDSHHFAGARLRS